VYQREQICHALGHAAIVIGGSEGIAPQILTSALGGDECGALRSRRFTRGDIASGSHWTGAGASEPVCTL
jgi:hypothetical protein